MKKELTEPINLREWRDPNNGTSTGLLFTCGRPGRATFERKRKLVPDAIIDQWESGLPKADIRHIVSLLGTKFHDGLSEFWYYPLGHPKSPVLSQHSRIGLTSDTCRIPSFMSSRPKTLNRGAFHQIFSMTRCNAYEACSRLSKRSSSSIPPDVKRWDRCARPSDTNAFAKPRGAD